MTCNRCSDIHTAQLAGKQRESCTCNCHDKPQPELRFRNMGGTMTVPCNTPQWPQLKSCFTDEERRKSMGASHPPSSSFLVIALNFSASVMGNKTSPRLLHILFLPVS